MREACETLRLMDGDGMSEADYEASERTTGSRKKDMGRLYRIAMLKTGLFHGVPIEYARIQTDSPSRDGWNHEWTR